MRSVLLALRAACLLSLALWIGLGCSSLLGLETDRSLDTVYPIGGYEGCNAHGCDACTSAYHRCVCTARRGDPSEDEYQLAASCFLETRDPYPGCAAGHECNGCGDVLTRCLCEEGASAQANCVRRAKNSADGGTDGGPETGPDAGPLSCETDPPDPCFTCRCEECDTEFSDCLNDAGCIDILDCAGTAACILLPVTGAPSDPNDCYQSTQCQDVIDGTGGPEGASYQAILDLLDCAAYADCPACDSDDCSFPACSGCADACSECLCLGGTEEECGCVDPPPTCEHPQCDCGSCFDSCMCQLNDVTRCDELCGEDCSSADGCGCANPVAACVCETGAFGNCLAELGACYPPICNCGSCVEDCTCAMGDPNTCGELCSQGTISACAPGVLCEPHVRLVDPYLTYAACCVEGYACGIDVGNEGYCSLADQAGTYTDACPPLPGDDTLHGLLGCCQANGVCGYDASLLGLGCVPTEVFSDDPAASCSIGPTPPAPAP